HLRPKTTGNRVRQYTEKDIDQIKVIYNLVKVRGFKIAAARKFLNENRTGAEKSQQIMETLTSVRDQLKELKRKLEGLV
ncbi:MerR family transcriptional regulator, partial [Veillonella nakazawae]|nr:MerR family transcriptional regulator [Veillonella nakazawae]